MIVTKFPNFFNDCDFVKYMARSKTEIQADITATKELISALKSRRLSLVSGGATEWETRDGNLVRRVKNMSLSEINEALGLAQAELEDLEAELNGYAGLAFSLSPQFANF